MVVDGAPVAEAGEGSEAGDCDVFRGGLFRTPRAFDEEVGGDGGVGGAEDGKCAVEPFGVDEVIFKGWADAENGGGLGGEDATGGADDGVVGEGLEIEVSQGFDVKFGIPVEVGRAAGFFVEDRAAPCGEGEFEVEEGSFVWAAVRENGFVGVVGIHGAFGEGGGDEQGVAVLVIDEVIVVVAVETSGYFGPQGFGIQDGCLGWRVLDMGRGIFDVGCHDIASF